MALIIPKNEVLLNIYNSKECSWCDNEIKRFNNHLKKFRGSIKTVTRNIEDVQDVQINNLGIFPVVDFGNGITEKGKISKMDHKDIMTRIIESAHNGDISRSFTAM